MRLLLCFVLLMIAIILAYYFGQCVAERKGLCKYCKGTGFLGEHQCPVCKLY